MYMGPLEIVLKQSALRLFNRDWNEASRKLNDQHVNGRYFHIDVKA